MIKVLATDIDGVLTDGKGYVLQNNMLKTICFQDIDAVGRLKCRGIKFAVVSGEKNDFTDFIINKLSPDYFYVACKNKVAAIQEIMEKEHISQGQIAYIGDGKYDISAIKYAGLGICPHNAIEEVRNVADYVLRGNGGNGCLEEAYQYIKGYNNIPELRSGITDIFREHKNLVERVWHDEVLIHNIQRSIFIITEALKQGKQILLCGNGGSAADAQHIATEFVSRFNMERKALNAEALSVNTSSLTAIGNDYDFDCIFARQIEAKGKIGDILIGISTSGKSHNVLKAFSTAKRIGMLTIALTGKNGDLIKNEADIVISVSSDCTARIQEMHIMIGHIICEYVELLMFREDIDYES